jgi:hypothetical protein
MKKSFIIFILSALFVSSIWLLAAADGTMKIINTWFLDRTEINLLQQKIEILELKNKKGKLEVSILKSAIKKKAYQYQIDYITSKGY